MGEVSTERAGSRASHGDPSLWSHRSSITGTIIVSQKFLVEAGDGAIFCVGDSTGKGS